MRKWMIALACAGTLTTGCLSDADRKFFTDQGVVLQGRIEEYKGLLAESEKTIAEIKAAIDAKEIDLAGGLALIEQVKSQAADYKAAIRSDQDRMAEIDERLRDKSGAEKWEALGWTLASIAASLAGVRLTRGPSSRPFKNADGSIKG